jgi:hypothetical protein
MYPRLFVGGRFRFWPGDQAARGAASVANGQALSKARAARSTN